MAKLCAGSSHHLADPKLDLPVLIKRMSLPMADFWIIFLENVPIEAEQSMACYFVEWCQIGAGLALAGALGAPEHHRDLLCEYYHRVNQTFLTNVDKIYGSSFSHKFDLSKWDGGDYIYKPQFCTHLAPRILIESVCCENRERAIIRRREKLTAALAARGLALREDSKLCRKYIYQDIQPDLNYVVEVMDEMRFYIKKTRYRNIRNLMVRKEWQAARWDAEAELQRHGQRAKKKALEEYLQSKHLDFAEELQDELLPPSLRHHVEYAAMRQNGKVALKVISSGPKDSASVLQRLAAAAYSERWSRGKIRIVRKLLVDSHVLDVNEGEVMGHPQAEVSRGKKRALELSEDNGMAEAEDEVKEKVAPRRFAKQKKTKKKQKARRWVRSTGEVVGYRY